MCHNVKFKIFKFYKKPVISSYIISNKKRKEKKKNIYNTNILICKIPVSVMTDQRLD